MNFAPFWVFYPVFFCINSLFAQAQNGQDTVKPPARFSFLQKAQSPQKARIWGVSGGILTAYTGASLGLHYVWYAQWRF